MYKNIKKAIIALAAVMMLVSGATIVESAELAEAQGYVEIVPFVSGCFFRVTQSTGVSVFQAPTGNALTTNGSNHLAPGTQVWATFPNGSNAPRVRIGAGRYINQTGIGMVSCG